MKKTLALLETVRSFIEECSANSSHLVKASLLRKYESSEFMSILIWTYDPYRQFFMSSANYLKRPNVGMLTAKTNDLFELLQWLNTREITGHNAIAAVNDFVGKIEDVKLKMTFFKILDKDFKCGVDAKTINSVFPKLIPEFYVALGVKMEKVPNFTEEHWYVSRKIDGVRCLAIKKEGKVVFVSRQGKFFETLGVLKEIIESHGWDNFVLDGELCIVQNGREEFQDVMKEIRKKNHAIKHPVLYAFDLLKLPEFESGESERLLNVRQQKLMTLVNQMGGRHVKWVEQELVTDNAFLKTKQNEAIENGWEGLILRRDTRYNGKRSNDILKVKQFEEAEYVVKGVTTGPFTVIENEKTKVIECVTSLIINHKGNKVGVGSGLSVDQRKAWFRNPRSVIGKTITVRYFSETKDQKGKPSLRFPTFRVLHGEKREV